MKKLVLFYVLLSPFLGNAQSEPVWILNGDSGINNVLLEYTDFEKACSILVPEQKIISSIPKHCRNNRKVLGTRWLTCMDTNRGISLGAGKYRRLRKMLTWSPPKLYIISITKGSFSDGIGIGISTPKDVCTLYPNSKQFDRQGVIFIRTEHAIFRFEDEGKLDRVDFCFRCGFGTKAELQEKAK
ncbi:MAG: hypothetical protein GC180_07465 [Bacteroidetes bacterium]|nr:hypothetical protein [Bacteroidota bacterium]